MSSVRFNRSQEFIEWARYQSEVSSPGKLIVETQLPDGSTIVEDQICRITQMSDNYLEFVSSFRSVIGNEECAKYGLTLAVLDPEAAKAIACAKFVLREVCNDNLNNFKSLLTKFNNSFTKLLKHYEAQDLQLDQEKELREAEAKSKSAAEEKQKADAVRSKIELYDNVLMALSYYLIQDDTSSAVCFRYDTAATVDGIYNLLFRQGEAIGEMTAKHLDDFCFTSKLKDVVLAELQADYKNVHDAAKSYEEYLKDKKASIEAKEAVYQKRIDKHTEAANIHCEKLQSAITARLQAETLYNAEMRLLSTEESFYKNSAFYPKVPENVEKDLDKRSKEAKAKFSQAEKKYLAEYPYHMSCEAWHRSEVSKESKNLLPLIDEKAAIEKKLTETEDFISKSGGNEQVKDISVEEYRKRFRAMYTFDKNNDWQNALAAERNPITNVLVRGLVRVGQIVGGVVATIIPALKNWHNRLFRPEGYGVVLQNHAVVDKVGLNRSVRG